MHYLPHIMRSIKKAGLTMKCAALLNKAYMQYNSATCKITYFYKLRAAADLIGAFCFYSV